MVLSVLDVVEPILMVGVTIQQVAQHFTADLQRYRGKNGTIRTNKKNGHR